MVLRTLIAHYRRHPMQAFFLLVGIVIANVLLVGTQLINAQARSSYAKGEALAGSAGQIVPSGTSPYLDERLFVELRAQGFDKLLPILRLVERTSSGQVIELMGIDVLSIPRTTGGEPPDAEDTLTRWAGSQGFEGFAFPPYRTLVATARLKQLGLQSGELLTLAEGGALPPLQMVDSDQLGHRMLIDIGALQIATATAGRLTAIQVYEEDAVMIDRLIQQLPPSARLVSAEAAADPAELTASFHLNLAAMGLLSCVVGLFLTYNAIAFSYSDRRELLRRMRLAGVSQRSLALALCLELLVFLVVGGVIGLWLGALLAAQLLPGVGQTLAQLYDVYIAYPDDLLAGGYLLPLTSTALAAVLSALIPMRQALTAPLLGRRSLGWHLATAAIRDRRLAMAGAALLGIAILVAQTASSTWMALGGMAALLLGAALCLPSLLRSLLKLMMPIVPVESAKISWLLADSRWLLGPAALALMAMLMALVANSGLNAMVASFRDATDRWLEQRLVAQLYLRDRQGRLFQEIGALDSWLASEAPAASYTLRHGRDISVVSPRGRSVSVEVIDLSENEPFRSSVQLIQSESNAVSRFHAGEGIFISERAWRLDGWQLGEDISLCDPSHRLPILGIYHDYGNPRSQWMTTPAQFRVCWPDQIHSGIAVHGPPSMDWDALRVNLGEYFGFQDAEMTDQRQLRAIALAVFDRTFRVTQALNGLTLLVAGIGVFCAVSAIHHHRVGQQALLASLGLSRRERGGLLLAQWGLMGLLCMVVVAPFGLALGWYLSSVVTPVAFGWSFPLVIEVQPLVNLAGVAAGAMVIAVVLPSLQLLRVSPAAMLRELST